MKRYTFLILIMVLLFLTIGCVTPIADISENPQKYSGKEVVINGTIFNVVNIPLVDSSLFLFGDEENKIPVVSSVKHEKGEAYLLKGRVMAFPEEGSKEASREVIGSIADFLVEKEVVEEKKADKAATSILKGLYRLSEGLGQMFFIIEKDDPQQ